VIEPAATIPATLAEFARRGVRGLRLNLYSPVGSATPPEIAFAALAAPARELGWHVEVIAALDVLVTNTDRFARAGVPVVIDHYGLTGRASPASPAGQGFLAVLRLPNIWLKLSAPYRVSDDPLATSPDPAWLAAIVAAAPERCVWGSDWPHTPPHAAQKDGAQTLPYRALSYGRLVDDFVAAVGSITLAEQIMGANAARLYGF
jgi:predicted TIM-barrel fold metal-dependent hydrolase